MSLVGNFTQNYDRSTQQGGSSLQRAHSNVSFHQDDTVHASTTGKSHLPTIAQEGQNYPPTDGQLYPTGGSDNDQSSTPMSMTDTLTSRTQHVTSLARNLSRRSDQQGNLFDYEEGSDLDPFSNNFNAQKWTRQLSTMRDEGSPGRQAGLAYKNMSVHGFGSDAGKFTSVGSMSELTTRLPEDSLQHAPVMGRSYSRQDLWQKAQGPDLERH